MWGVCKKVENGGVFNKKVENGGVFVKKWTFPQRTVHYVQYQYQYFLFHVLLIWGVGTHPTHPPLVGGVA